MVNRKPEMTAIESVLFAIQTVLTTSGVLLFLILLVFVLVFYWQHSGK